MPASFCQQRIETPMSKPSAERNLAASLQGIYYVASGLWPILHMRSFERVTGPKRDKWLVKTVGALITAIGSTLLFSAAREPESETARNLGISAALALIGIDLVYSIRGTIPKIYLMDAAVEAALVAGLLAGRPELDIRRDNKNDRRK
jgi:hypothetical protein